MLKLVDNLLNRITMYRLVLYYLIILIVVAAGLGAFGLLPLRPVEVIFSALFITAICWLTNKIFAAVYRAPANVESLYITALILALIISPPQTFGDLSYYSLAFWASIWAMASKYIFAIRKKHLFNPAAFGVALTAFTINLSASWWVGTLHMLPFVAVGGLLIARKIRRFDLVLAFFAAALVVILPLHVTSLPNLGKNLLGLIEETPLLFFAFVMLTEPLTTPPKRFTRMLYGVLTGILFSPAVHLGSLYSTPELALLVGNVYSYLVSPKAKLILALKEKIEVAKNTFDFAFTSSRPLAFEPGQYLEWTLAHPRSDSRGNRRYFTIASSPTEQELRVGIKFSPSSSSFKRSLLSLKPGGTLVASQLAGEFVLPKDQNKKIVLVAGGIGVTPFRSMIKYLLDKNERRPIVILYSNRTAEDIAYREFFDEAEKKLGIKTIHVLTEKDSLPAGWNGETGRVDAAMIKRVIPDFQERYFYISGPHALVTGFQETLKALGVSRRQIKTDFFPGFV